MHQVGLIIGYRHQRLSFFCGIFKSTRSTRLLVKHKPQSYTLIANLFQLISTRSIATNTTLADCVSLAQLRRLLANCQGPMPQRTHASSVG
jgi:hypothetical protein